MPTRFTHISQKVLEKNSEKSGDLYKNEENVYCIKQNMSVFD
jgi:hypothetical protein